MIPQAYRHSLSSSLPTPLDLNNEDQYHQLFSPNHQTSSSSSSLSSYPINLFHQDHQDHEQGSYYWDPKPLQIDQEEGEKNIPYSGSWDHPAAEELKDHESSTGLKLTIKWKNENRVENFQTDDEDGSSPKWMSSKMRMMRKMMVSDQTVPDVTENSLHKVEDQKQPFPSLGGTDQNSSNNCNSNHSNITVRVCSDCHTTKTPLWRSGPRGPKSLCNACGIRQRKARRAMAAAAAAAAAESANGTVVVSAKTSMKGNKLHKKKSKMECAPPQMKKKRKLGAKPSSRDRTKKFSFEDLRLSLSKKHLALQQVFPQDEKEAAILLMALSYGLVHG